MRLLILVLLMAVMSSAQVRVTPNMKPFVSIYSGVVTGATAGTYTTAFPVKNILGNTTIFIKGDTTAASTGVVKVANRSDSCLTLGFQLKDTNLGWGTLYTSATNNYTRIDTVDRAYVNVGGTVIKYLDLGALASYALADSARLWFSIGTGDSLLLNLEVGSQ